LRVAIDVRPLASPLTGIGRYTDSLVRRLVQSDDCDWFLYSDRPLTTILPVAGNVTVRTGNASGGSPGSLRWAQWEYVRWAKQDRIDTFWSPRHHLPLMLPSRIRTVVTIHDLVWKRYPETMQRKNYWLEKLLMGPSIRKSDGIIAVSNFTAAEISHFYPDAAPKTTVIYEAAELFKGQSSIPGNIPERFILFVGTLEPRKNLELLLQAYAETDASCPPLVIAGGSGWGNLRIESIVNDLGIKNRTTLLGFVSEQELHGLYGRAVAMVMPSHYEGFGLPAVEAMHYGVPCIVSKGTALEEICSSAALLVEPTSKVQLSEAITKICDETTNARLSRAARGRASQFSWDIAAKHTLDVLTAV